MKSLVFSKKEKKIHLLYWANSKGLLIFGYNAQNTNERSRNTKFFKKREQEVNDDKELPAMKQLNQKIFVWVIKEKPLHIQCMKKGCDLSCQKIEATYPTR